MSSVESCGFITYILCFPIGFIYVCWIIFPDDTLHAMDITYYPHKSLGLIIPTGIFVAFVSTPFLYALINYLSAPSYHSIDTLWDESSNFHADPRSNKSDNNSDYDKNESNELSPSPSSCIPSIYDIDVSIINRSIAKQIQSTQMNKKR